MTVGRPYGRWTGSGTAFGVVVGLFLGVLIGDLVVPKHQSVVTTAGPSASLSGAGAGAIGAGGQGGQGAGSASGTGDQSATAAGAAAAGSGGAGAGGGLAGPSAAYGGAGGSSGAGGAAGSAAPAGSAGGTTSGVARGVTADTIKIGIAYADLSALKTLGPAYDNGNVPEQWKAVLDGWHRQGLVPVNGRDIQLVFSSYNVLDLAAQRSSCASLIQDHGVFAVVGVAYFSVGSDCVAAEYHTPMLTSDGPGADVFQRGWPYLFSIDESSDRTLENMLYWADGHGALRGKKIGVYYANDGIEPQLVDRSLRPTLAHLGYRLAAEATTSAQDTNGGPEDAVAVQRFRAAGVDLAILLTSKTGFLQAANAQAYRPTYIDSDYLYGTSDTATSTYPSAEWDGTNAITTSRRGEPAAGIPLSAAQEACLQNYERYSGTKLARPSPTSKETAVYAYVLTACDEGGVLLDAIRAAGRNLTAGTLVSSLEGIHGRTMLRWDSISFSGTRHDGVDDGRTLVWRAACTCYVAQGTFTPLTVR